jgi:hippurate hydrolase
VTNFPALETLREYEPELIALRRDIHQHPETAFEETRTAALVAGKLREWGIEVAEGIAKTGVVGTLKGRRPGQRAIGLRADMDALNIHEKTGAPYASEVPGKMHACGHDGHSTMLLGAARYLAEHPDFAGTVHFIFHPAEEGQGGGRVMMEEGLFDRFPVDAVYGLHNHPGLEVGKFQTRTGAFMAASDSWTVTFHGTGGHGGAGPHLATDATVAQAHFVLALQSIIGRNVPATTPAVLSVGHIAAGAWGSPNVMPSEVIVRGTARSYEPAVRDLLERRIGEVAQAMAAGQGCTATVHYERRYPPLVTHAEQTRISVEAAAAVVGEACVGDSAPLRTGAEDFSFMLLKRPGSFMFIGNGVGADGKYHGVHTPLYDFNDEILTLGAAYWVSLVQTELNA